MFEMSTYCQLTVALVLLNMSFIYVLQTVCDAYDKSSINQELVSYAKSMTDNPQLTGIIVSSFILF